MAQKPRRTAASKSAKNESAKERGKKSAKESSKQTMSAAKKSAGKKGAVANKPRKAAAPRQAKAAVNDAPAAPTLPVAANLPAAAQAIQKAPKAARDIAAKSAPKPAAEATVGPTLEMHLNRVEDALGAFVATLADAERLHRQLDPGIANEPE